MASRNFDSQMLLCACIAGDNRLQEKLRREDLLPLGSASERVSRSRSLHPRNCAPDSITAHVRSAAPCGATHRASR
jgi:hypothetical protein